MFFRKTNELPIPSRASDDPQAREILRLWIAAGGQHISLYAGVWEDPAAWGLMLADILTHLCRCYAQDAGLDTERTRERILQALHAEMTHPTDKPSGEVS